MLSGAGRPGERDGGAAGRAARRAGGAAALGGSGRECAGRRCLSRRHGQLRQRDLRRYHTATTPLLAVPATASQRAAPRRLCVRHAWKGGAVAAQGPSRSPCTGWRAPVPVGAPCQCGARDCCVTPRSPGHGRAGGSGGGRGREGAGCRLGEVAVSGAGGRSRQTEQVVGGSRCRWLGSWRAGRRDASSRALFLLWIVCTARCSWQVVWLTRRPFVFDLYRGTAAPWNGVNLFTELLFLLPIGLFGYGAFVAQKYAPHADRT